MKSKPIAVLGSDWHYSLSTCEIADRAFRAAINKAAEFEVPLIDAGDITSDKDILRGKYVNKLIETFKYAKKQGVKIYDVIGNHSLINEKGDEHTLHFLEPYSTVIGSPSSIDGFNFIPYQNSAEKFLSAIKKFPKGSIVIGHQGTIGGFLGDYVKDSSAFDPKLVKDYRVFLGHYHRHYELGTTVSIGNPYSLTFGEANDGPKGFLILYSDGSFKREILNYRKHAIVNEPVDFLKGRMKQDRLVPGVNKDDIVWLKVSGPRSELDKLNKREIGMKLLGHSNYRLDKIVIENSDSIATENVKIATDGEILDSIIDRSSETVEQKQFLRTLWREVVEEK